jgi:hypothetical protein
LPVFEAFFAGGLLKNLHPNLPVRLGTPVRLGPPVRAKDWVGAGGTEVKAVFNNPAGWRGAPTGKGGVTDGFEVDLSFCPDSPND